MEKQLKYIRQNEMFGLNDTLEDNDWNDLELIQSEIVTNLANTVQYYWLDDNDYSKNRLLLDYLQVTPVNEILENIHEIEKYNIANYTDSMMLLAKDIYENIGGVEY